MPRNHVAEKTSAKSAETAVDKYFRAVNYLAAAQIYLQDNPLLEEPLRADHIKPRLLGHWGTAPGINLVYTHLNKLILNTAASVLLVTGPGHGAAANLANMYLEGTLAEFYPELTLDRRGLKELVMWFSWPRKFPSHLNPALPGVIHEGGELGYALATAYGAALDNPDLLVACIVGDGEAETGPTAGAWHSNKFLSPATDGAVLPILHLNGYKISSPTIFGTMSDEELTALFTGYGYQVRIVSLSDSIQGDAAEAFAWAYAEIRMIQNAARGAGVPPLRGADILSARSAGVPPAKSGGNDYITGKMPVERAGETPTPRKMPTPRETPTPRPNWPMIVLRTPKGWTGMKELDGHPIEGSFRAHQVPGKDLATNPKHLKAVEKWLRSYRPWELWDSEGRPIEEIRSLCPTGDKRMAMNPHGFGSRIYQPLELPRLEDFAVKVEARGATAASGMELLGQYLSKVIQRNAASRNFRIMCPDELESNRLGAVLDVTARQYAWPIPPAGEHLAADGRVMEVLSEHNCQGWLQGYLLTGRHGLFPCYEAFISIVDGMMNQYAKFLKSSGEVPWRGKIASLNYILTSEAWRQDHNGYSHQGPGFLNNLLTKKGHTYRIYLPPDANCVLSMMEHCLESTNYINLVIAGKQPMPQWLSLGEAVEHCRTGLGTWPWASTNEGEDPDIVLCCIGDNLTLETLAGAQLLRQEAPEWNVRVVNVVRLMTLGIPQKYPSGIDEDHFQRVFPLGVPVIVNFHGYTAAIKQLVWERPGNDRFDINGYREEGTTTTPFDMHIQNRTSRFHQVMQSARKIARRKPSVAAKADALIRKYEGKILEHAQYIVNHGIDLPEVTEWKWEA